MLAENTSRFGIGKRWVSPDGDMQSSCTRKDEEGEDASNLKALENRVFCSVLQQGTHYYDEGVGTVVASGRYAYLVRKTRKKIAKTLWDRPIGTDHTILD